MTFRFVLAMLLTFVSLSVAQFASLTINPKGEQQIDITTGITTLPQGGEIIDKGRGIKLSAGFIEYQDGIYIKAQNAQAEGFFGVLTTPELNLDASKNVISATGGISLNQGGLSLTADALTLYLDQGITVLSSNVSNRVPSFQTAHLVIKIGAGYALLVSPFTYQDGVLNLSKSTSGSLIQLNQTKEADDSFTYSISTTLDENVNAELSPYVP
jgi:hypothetical protein